MRRTLLIFVFLLVAGLPAHAEWTRAGLYGADVRSLVVDPRNPDRVFLGTSQGEVYLSVDGGREWINPRNGVPFPGYIVDNLAVDDQGRLWAASWGLWGGGVLAVSEDGGTSWQRRDKGIEDLSIRAFVVDPSDRTHLLAGGLTGVFRSRDSGASWTKISDRENVESLAIDPRSSDTIYVGTWRQAWRSDDGGKRWKHVDKGMVLDTDVFAIEIDRTNPDNVWLSTCGWVYNSADRGDTWVRFKEGFDNRRIHAVAIDPLDSKTVYAGSVAGLYRSPDAGKSWKVISDTGLVINVIGLHPKRPGRIILGTEGDGVYISEDKGKTFVRSSFGLQSMRVASVVADPVKKNTVYAAVMFGGSASGVYRSADAGKNWSRMNETKLPEILSLVVRGDVSPRFLAGTEQGFFYSDDGREWTRSEPVLLPVRVDKVLPYNATRLFAATSNGVFTTKDGGKSWYRLVGSNVKAVDIAIGHLGDKRALYALKSTGLNVFDGTQWLDVSGAPDAGRSLALTVRDGRELVVVTSNKGVRSGHLDEKLQWVPVEAPDLAFASAIETEGMSSRTVYLTSREATSMLVADASSRWRQVPLPARSMDIASISHDPFQPSRFYLGTRGQGVLIFTGTGQQAAPQVPRGAQSAGGGSK